MSGKPFGDLAAESLKYTIPGFVRYSSVFISDSFSPLVLTCFS